MVTEVGRAAISAQLRSLFEGSLDAFTGDESEEGPEFLEVVGALGFTPHRWTPHRRRDICTIHGSRINRTDACASANRGDTIGDVLVESRIRGVGIEDVDRRG